MFDNLPNYFNTKLKDLFVWLELVRDDKWYWFANTRCKYVNIRIDTRNGGYVYIRDDHGNQMSLEELMRQGGSHQSQEWHAAMAMIEAPNDKPPDGKTDTNIQP